MLELALIFVTGLLLSFHCVGMCGGFVALLAVRPASGPIQPTSLGAAVARSWGIVIPQQLLFHLGRIATYAGLGAAAGAVGSFSVLFSRTGRAQALLMVAAGVLMIASGLALVGLMQHWSLFQATTANLRPWLARSFEKVVRLPGALRAVPLGTLLGFLPCGLIYSMLGKAASTGSAVAGALVMLAFGVGTIPALLLVAFFADLLSVTLRARLVRVSGLLLAALGAITLYRGIDWLGHPLTAPSMHHFLH